MKTSIFNLLSDKKPGKSEYSELVSTPFERKPISPVERNSIIKRGFFWLGVSVFCLVAGFVGFLIGRQGAGSAGSGMVSFMGLVIMLGCPIGLIIAISTFFGLIKDPRSKTPEAGLNNYITRVIVGDDSDDFSKKSIDYAFSVLRRLVPDSLIPEQKAFEAYLTGLRSEIREAIRNHYAEYMNKTVEEISKDGGWSYGISNIGIATGSCLSTPISNGITESKCEFILTHSINEQQGGKSVQVPYSQVKIVIEAVVVQSGGFWFVYDPMPEYRVNHV